MLQAFSSSLVSTTLLSSARMLEVLKLIKNHERFRILSPKCMQMFDCKLVQSAHQGQTWLVAFLKRKYRSVLLSIDNLCIVWLETSFHVPICGFGCADCTSFFLSFSICIHCSRPALPFASTNPVCTGSIDTMCIRVWWVDGTYGTGKQSYFPLYACPHGACFRDAIVTGQDRSIGVLEASYVNE